MSDRDPAEFHPQQTPRNSGVLPTDQERRAEEERQRIAAERKAEDAYKDRQVKASEAANDLVRSNRNLQIAVIVFTAITAWATFYQGVMNRNEWRTAQATLGQMRTDAQASSDTFQAQIHHYDATLGQTQIIATQARTQAEQTTKLAGSTKTLARAAGTQATATQSLAGAAQQTADTAKDAIYEEQRPWVGIDFAPTKAFNSYGGLSADSKPLTIAIVARNTGRTPALKWRLQCCIAFTRRLGNQTVFDCDALRANPIAAMSDEQLVYMRSHPEEAPRIMRDERDRQTKDDAYYSESSQVIPPNGTHTLTEEEISSPDTMFHYMIGKMLYWDAINPAVEHTTKFCLVRYSSHPWTLCKSGQEMN